MQAPQEQPVPSAQPKTDFPETPAVFIPTPTVEPLQTVALADVQDAEPILSKRIPTPQEAKGIRVDEARENFIKELRIRRAQEEAPKPAVVSAPTDRQRERREAEMGAGRAALAKNIRSSQHEFARGREVLQPTLVRPVEGEKTEPVMRDGEHVPKFGEGNTGARTVRGG